MSDTPPPRWQVDVAETWAQRLTQTAYIPMSRQVLRQRLEESVQTVVDVLDKPECVDAAGRAVGADLVAMRATGTDSLTTSLELLRETIFDTADADAANRGMSLLSSIAAGYAGADRESTFEQQETLKQALLRSKLEADRERDTSEQHFYEVFSSAPIGVAISEIDGTIVEANPALVEMLKCQQDALESLTIRDLFHPDDANYLVSAYHELVEQDGPRRLHERRRMMDADGVAIECYLAVSVLRDSSGAPRYFVTMAENISELHRLQESFHHQALHDVMTSLPNRQFFRTRLEASLVNLPKDAVLALYHLGLNGFEQINDGLGYDVGDILIKSVARRLEQVTEGLDGMVARFGGTEFAILVHEKPDTPRVPAFVEVVNAELSEPVYVGSGNQGIATSASIGVVRATVAEADPSNMIWAADVALRRAEAAGHRQWALFDPDRAPNERIEAKLAAIIPGALELGDFNVAYRPIIAMRSQRLAALEVQLSWEPDGHPKLDHVRCQRLAERSGVTLSLRDWVLRSAWDRLSDWHAAGYRPCVAIGLSHNQAKDPDLLASVRGILRERELDPSYLWLSIPFSAVTGGRDEARENVGFLHELGVRTSLHGFRASPEEFRYLHDLPVHAVRLAPELIRIMHESGASDGPEARALHRLLPLLSEGQRWIVIGELDVEQIGNWTALGAWGAGVGPGYGQPRDASDVPELLDEIPVVADEQAAG